jgi:hypothetical protein
VHAIHGEDNASFGVFETFLKPVEEARAEIFLSVASSDGRNSLQSRFMVRGPAGLRCRPIRSQRDKKHLKVELIGGVS